MSNIVISTFLSTFGQIGQNGQHLRKSHYKFYYFFLVTFIKKSVQSVQNVQTYWYDWSREFGQNYFKMSKMSKVSTKIIYFRIFNECFGQKHVKIGKKLKKNKDISHKKWTNGQKLPQFGQIGQNRVRLDKIFKSVQHCYINVSKHFWTNWTKWTTYLKKLF